MSTEASPDELEAVQEKLEHQTSRWTSGLAKIIRREHLVVIVLAVLVASTCYKNYYKAETFEKSVGDWGIFHYYLGAKYFSEIGYFNLYTCALEADDEAARYWFQIAGARDMETYRLLLRSSLPPCPRTNFTTERWSEFSQDVEHFARPVHPYYFAQVLSDKGFNPPPSWVAVAKPLAQAVPISKSWATDTVFNLDLIAVLVGVLIIWRSHGGIVALLTAGLAIFYFGNYGDLGWNFLQYFWFPLVAVAVILWMKNRPGFSGAVLGIAVGLQTFPLFFGLPIVVRGITEFLRHRNKADWRPYFRFTGALFAVMLASFLLGSLAGRGVGAWGEWQRKISIHKNYLRGEIFDIGLANLTAETVSRNHNEVAGYADDVPNTFARLDSLKSNIWIYYVLCAMFLAMWALSVVRAPSGDLFGHGFLTMYAAVSLSPFYYLSLALVPLMFWKSSRILRLYATWGTVALFAAHAILFRGGSVSFQYLPHLLSEYLIALFLVGLAVISIFSCRLARQEPTVAQQLPEA